MADVEAASLEGSDLGSMAQSPSGGGAMVARSLPPVFGANMCLWRGYGGGVPTLNTVEFDKQLDKVSIWLEHWDHEQVGVAMFPYLFYLYWILSFPMGMLIIS